MKSLMFILIYIISLAIVLALWNLLGYGLVKILKKISPKRYLLGDKITILFLMTSFVWIVSWYYLFLHLKV